MRTALPVLTVALVLGSGLALAHGEQQRAGAAPNAQSPDATAFGRPGDPAAVTRTVDVMMTDAMRFSPSTLSVKKGETIRFIVHNNGGIQHEMVLGTDKELRAHAELMRKFPEMEHAEPHMVHVSPGKQGEMVWTFDKRGNFSFACLVPGHLEAGMKGKVRVE